MKKIYILLIILFIYSDAFAQNTIGIIPYKIANPTDEFTIETGNDYAKMLSIAAGFSKYINITDSRSINNALKKLSLNSQRLITEDDIIKIGETSGAELILIGTLSRSKGNYISESVLYSIEKRRIVSRSRSSAGNIFKLAGDEVNDIFYSLQDKSRSFAAKYIEAAVLLDLSYKIASEWPSIKKGISRFADTISENWNIETEVNIIPFSDKHTELNKYLGLKSSVSINEKLSKMIPAGGNSKAVFQKALNYTVKNLPWRRDSDKVLIILSNSENAEGRFFEKYALDAKAKKIAVNTISLGLIRADSMEPLRQFASAGAGKFHAVSYHQRFYNETGDPLDLFFQGGRLFTGSAFDSSWKSGLFEAKTNRKFYLLDKPKDFLSEIFYDEKKYNINPYNLPKHYPLLARVNLVNHDQIEENIESVFENIGESFEYSSSKARYVKPIAKALITDGRVTMWIKIKNDEDFNYLKKHENDKAMFPLGVVVKKSPNDPYGINFYPESYLTGYLDENIPSNIKTSISRIIKQPDYYTSTGLLNPPVWFIDINVKQIEKLRKEYDIREMGR